MIQESSSHSTRRWRGVDSNFSFRNCSARQALLRRWLPALSSRPPVDGNSVTSGPAEFDPVLHAPLPQSRLLGLVREIVPPFEGAPTHQQIFISAVSTSLAEDVANFVVVVG